jgi:hypothetical protein
MSNLRPDAQALVDAGREALKPASADRERIFSALQSHLAAGGAASGAATVAPAAATGGLSWPAISLLAVGLALGGGLAFHSLSGDEGAPVSPPPQPAGSAVPTAAATVSAAPPPVVEAAPTPTPPASETRAQASRRSAGRLAEEVEILSRAQTELHAGRFAGALRVLDEHAQKFPRGTLAQERVAARIQALCGAGRVTEASAELGRLSPGSLHEARARAACAKKK